MNLFVKIILCLSLFFIFSCSASHKKLNNSKFNPPNKISKYLFNEYKKQANFEALEMHDWNSAKLYSEKALLAASGVKILPEKITYWELPNKDHSELIMNYTNLINIYDEGVLLDPENLAKAIVSLDCWAEQKKEGWQTWDINKCRIDFLKAMHTIYILLDNDKKKYSQILVKKENNKEELISKKIVYFDFNKSKLSNYNINEIKNFIKNHKSNFTNIVVKSHTDTKGSKKYNYTLSEKRSVAINNLLIKLEVKINKILLINMGESDLLIETKDETAHPANRRAEISLLN